MTNSKTPKSAMVVAVDYLSRRALTHYELETRLKQKGFESSEIHTTLTKLEEWGYLNDEELAFTFSQNRLKRYSRRRVLHDLQNRGLETPKIEQALESTYSSEDEFQQCLTLTKKWWKQERKRWEQKIHVELTKRSVPRELWIQQKIARKLVQRGYPSDMVWNTLNQIQSIYNDKEQYN